jgi:hypothetical protein
MRGISRCGLSISSGILSVAFIFVMDFSPRTRRTFIFSWNALQPHLNKSRFCTELSALNFQLSRSWIRNLGGGRSQAQHSTICWAVHAGAPITAAANKGSPQSIESSARISPQWPTAELETPAPPAGAFRPRFVNAKGRHTGYFCALQPELGKSTGPQRGNPTPRCNGSARYGPCCGMVCWMIRSLS